MIMVSTVILCMIRWTNSGTNTGPLLGNQPTGKPYVATGFDLSHFKW